MDYVHDTFITIIQNNGVEQLLTQITSKLANIVNCQTEVLFGSFVNEYIRLLLAGHQGHQEASMRK